MRTSSVLFRGALAAFCLLCVLSCEKDFTGRAIRFNARTRQGAPSTRTAYSGEINDQSGKAMERIDWSSGDKIILAMKNDDASLASQVYEVDGEITSSDHISEAGVVPYGSESGLQWGTGTHDFWAGYPSTVTVGNHTLSSSIPASQVATYAGEDDDVIRFDPEMDKAFMVAGLQSGPSESGISLDFYPAFTTFDITVGANTEITIDHFVMETTTYQSQTSGDAIPLSGGVLATFDPGQSMSYALSTSGSSSQSVSVTFDDGDGHAYRPIISTTTSMNFKVFALPRDITGLRITFFLGDGRTFSLNMKENGDWITFPATTKTNISGLLIPGATWYITFDYPRKEQWITHPDIEIGVE